MNAIASAPATPTVTAERPAELDLDRLSSAKFRAAYDLPYLASALFSLQIVPVHDLPSRSMAIDDQLRLYVDPGFVDEHSVSELAGVLCHEVLHVLMDHGPRATATGVATDEEAERWNIAGDAAINEILVNAATRTGATVELPDPILPGLLGFDAPDLTTEQMFHDLVAEPDATNDSQHEDSDVDRADGDVHPHQDGAGQDDIDHAAGATADHRAAAGNDGDAGRDDTGPVRRPCDCGSAADGIGRPWEDAAGDTGIIGMSAAEVEMVRHIVAAAVDAACRSGAGGRIAGQGGGELERWAQQLLAPTVDWRTQLRTHIRQGMGLAMGQVVPSYARPSRRSAATGGVILPGMRAPVPAVAVIVDTSGSMQPADLDDALGELAGILRSTGLRHRRLRVWACDEDAVEVGLRHGLAATSFPGGGGTDLAAGFEVATSRRNWRPDVIVVLTDGGTDWPAEPPAARVIVGLIGDDAIDSAPAWARTIRIETTPKGSPR